MGQKTDRKEPNDGPEEDLEDAEDVPLRDDPILKYKGPGLDQQFLKIGQRRHPRHTQRIITQLGSGNYLGTWTLDTSSFQTFGRLIFLLFFLTCFKQYMILVEMKGQEFIS